MLRFEGLLDGLRKQVPFPEQHALDARAAQAGMTGLLLWVGWVARRSDRRNSRSLHYAARRTRGTLRMNDRCAQGSECEVRAIRAAPVGMTGFGFWFGGCQDAVENPHPQKAKGTAPD